MKVNMGNFEVKLRKDEDVENLIRRFIRKGKRENIVDEIMERSRYKKPSEKNKENDYRRKMLNKKIRQKEIEEEKLADNK